jgi:hypothetical protein
MSVWDALVLLVVVIWRYISGHTISGVPSTNATWFKRGTMPKHRVNWWSGKPRIHRALYRIASIAIPVGWVWLYSHYRFWTLVVTLGIASTLIRHAWEKVVRHSPKQIQVQNFDTPSEIQEISVDDDPAMVQPKDMGHWRDPKRKAQ